MTPLPDPYSKGGEPACAFCDGTGYNLAGYSCPPCRGTGRPWPLDPDPLTVPEPEPLDSDGMCPNCISPWKCNGPHLAELTPYNRRHAAESEPARRSVVIPLILLAVVGVGLLALWVAVKW